jgi:hypothetical protein
MNARAQTFLSRITRPLGLYVAAALILALPAMTRVATDPDFWWHLKNGQLIIAAHHLISTDPYTYTVATHHWVMHEWLTEVGFAALYAVGGIGLILGVLSLISWVGIWFIAARAALRRVNVFALGSGILLAIFAGYPIWGPRAQMITFALVCAALFIAERHLLRGGRLAWVLVPIFLIWGNLHSGFVAGMGLLWLIWGVHAVSWTRHRDPEAKQKLVSLLVVLLACMAIVVINPNGPLIYLYPFQTVGSPAQEALIQEWHSPNFHMWEVWAFAFMMISTALMLVVNRKARAHDLVLFVVTVGLAMQSVRNIPLFVAAAGPLWIEQFSLLLERRAIFIEKAGSYVAPRALQLVTSGILLFLLAVSALVVKIDSAFGENNLLYTGGYPVCASRWLISAPPLRIFNQYGEGGYLAYKLSDHGDKVYIFGDAALMGDTMLEQYGAVDGLSPNWSDVVRNSGTQMILFDTGTPFDHLLSISPQWKLVYWDPHNVAYIPTNSNLVLPPVPAPTDACTDLIRRGVSS